MTSVQKLVVLPGETIAPISRYVHGHFAEHLGELVYPGIWVGQDSPIPNTQGLRNDVTEALRRLAVPVLRWPGGCFADRYHWRDGIGPRERRPMRVNVHWGMAEEPNPFGTHEFLAFCRLIGAAPYLCGNVGSGSPHELGDWVEYCNFAGRSALADERRANGADAPFGVRFWGIGNESWGCGGNMSPEEYAAACCRYATCVTRYPGADVHRIACGPNGADWAWTRRVFEALRRGCWDRARLVQSFAAHYYCGTAGTATEYTDEEWLELLAKAAAIEGLVTGHRQIMDEFDPQRRISLVVDEWGAWHPVEAGKPAGGLYQQNTIRDALVAALTLDVFHRQADKVFMANLAQVVNVLQSVVLTEGDRCIKTPTYYVFELYRPHRGAEAVRLECLSEPITDGGSAAEACRACYVDKRPFALPAVQGSASVAGGVLCLTACNAHPSEPVELAVQVAGAKLDEVEVVTLSAEDIHAHNTFEQPDAVRPSAPVTVRAKAGRLRVAMPAASVLRVMGPLA